MSKGYCEGKQNKCDATGCPLFGTLREGTDEYLRVNKCGDTSAPRMKQSKFKAQTVKVKRPRINFMSQKTKNEMPEREQVRRIVFARDMGLCRAKFLVTSMQCSGPLDVDEVIPRGRGGNYLDPTNCQVLCRAHHRWKHDNPAEAERLGLTKSLPPKGG